MPIKSFEFKFKLEAKDLIEFVVNRNIAVDIHATGVRREEVAALLPAANGHVPLALPAPKKKANESGREILEAYFLKHQDETITHAEMQKVLRENGKHYNHGISHSMMKKGLLRRVGKGQYRASAKLKAVLA